MLCWMLNVMTLSYTGVRFDDDVDAPMGLAEAPRLSLKANDMTAVVSMSQKEKRLRRVKDRSKRLRH